MVTYSDHGHTLYGDYRVTEGCWAGCDSQVPVGGVDRVCEGVGSLVITDKITVADSL